MFIKLQRCKSYVTMFITITKILLQTQFYSRSAYLTNFFVWLIAAARGAGAKPGYFYTEDSSLFQLSPVSLYGNIFRTASQLFEDCLDMEILTLWCWIPTAGADSVFCFNCFSPTATSDVLCHWIHCRRYGAPYHRQGKKFLSLCFCTFGLKLQHFN